MKKFLLFFTVFFISSTSLVQADTYTSKEGPPIWGPWYLYQSNSYPYVIECVYKRKEIKDKTNSRSIRTETQRVHIARYPFGRCADTLN